MKKLRTLTLLATSLALGSAYAVPADPTPMTYIQPDGSELTLVQRGNEYFHYLYDSEGTIRELGSDGYYRPVTHQGRALNAYLPSDLTQLRSMQAPVFGEETATPGVGANYIEMSKEGRSLFPLDTPDARGVVVLVEFPDRRFTVPDVVNAISKMLNEEGYTDYGSIGSARDYFNDVSNGKFHPHFDVCPTIVRMSKDPEYYAGTYGYDRVPDMVGEAMEQLVDDEFDFSKYDYDDDGKIDNVFFFYAGFGQADSKDKTTIWPHKGTYQVSALFPKPDIVLDGKIFNHYACGNELNYHRSSADNPYLNGIGTFVHEFGHVLGLPDLYDTSGQGTSHPEDMDVMSTGCYNHYSTCPPLYSAYEQWFCYWNDYTDVTEAGHYELKPMGEGGSAYRFRFEGKDDEYYFMECRGKSKWDAKLPDKGVTVWRMIYDYSSFVNNGVNSYGNSLLDILRPSAQASGYCFGEGAYSYIYPGGDASMSTSGLALTNHYVTGISFDRSTGTASFDYNLVTEKPEIRVVLHDNPKMDDDMREVYLTWDNIEDVEAYQWSGWYTNSKGVQTFIGKDVYHTVEGPTDHCTVSGFDSTSWRSECTFVVRAIKGLPSKYFSNQITFVPKNLEYDPNAGITEAVDNAETVEYYDLQGRRVQNPDKGLYIERRGTETRKIIL